MKRRRVGFTSRATCLLAAGITAALCGLVLGEIDLLRAGVLIAAVPLVAAAAVHRSRVRVSNGRRTEPAVTQAGRPVLVHLTLTNRSALPTGALMLEDDLPGQVVGAARFVLDPLGAHESRTVSYELGSLARGRHRTGPLRLRLTDPFHMVDLVRSFTATSDVLVLPIVDDLPGIRAGRSDDSGAGTGSHAVGSHGADDASTREYRTGDDLRKIHWRSSARVGQLMVRQEEQLWRARTTVVLDPRAAAHLRAPVPPGGDHRAVDSFEWAVSAVAGIAAEALRCGRDVGVLCELGRPERRPVVTSDDLGRQLAALSPSSLGDLATLGTALAAAARDSALVAVLGRLDAVSLRTLTSAQPRGGSTGLALLLDVDSWPGGRLDDSPDGLQRTVVQQAVDPRVAQVPIEQAAAALAAAGWRVTVVRGGTSIVRAWQQVASARGTVGAR